MKNWRLKPEEYLAVKYKYMKQRVTNVATNSSKKYVGLPICKKESFIEFGLSDSKFKALFKAYQKSKGARKKAPSIDRINNRKGYVFGNMQFLTVSANRSKEAKKKWIKLKNTRTGKLFSFSSTIAAAKFLQHKHRIKVSRGSFLNVKTGTKYLNVTRKKNTRK